MRGEIEKIIGETVGESSMLWEHVEKAGVFQSDDGVKITDRVSDQICSLIVDKLKNMPYRWIETSDLMNQNVLSKWHIDDLIKELGE